MSRLIPMWMVIVVHILIKNLLWEEEGAIPTFENYPYMYSIIKKWIYIKIQNCNLND